MKTDVNTASLRTLGAAAERRAPLLGRLVLGRLAAIESGSLTLFEGGRRHSFGRFESGLPDATLRVQDPRFWSAVAFRGGIGAGESYASGWWTSEDPAEVVRLFVRNRDVLSGVDKGLAWLSRPLLAGYHALRRNSVGGSRKNISAHYDLSNDFFALFLDDTMTYSSGIFEREDTSLREASVAKIDRLCRKLDLGPDDHLLEIGTGWGALALHAAREYGCRVTTTTISREQHDFAADRFREAGLEDRIDLRLEDYRDLTGQFDKIVSVEMIEAVGHQFYETFFRRCTELLRPGGRMCMQAINIADQHYERARRSVDFIQRHIFPGSCIPSVTALCSAATTGSDLRLTHMEDMGTHYARTLAAWRENLRERWDDARALGFDDDFLRLWEFYFCYCEGGFVERHIGVVQMHFARPGARQEPLLPPLTG